MDNDQPHPFTNLMIPDESARTTRIMPLLRLTTHGVVWCFHHRCNSFLDLHRSAPSTYPSLWSTPISNTTIINNKTAMGLFPPAT